MPKRKTKKEIVFLFVLFYPSLFNLRLFSHWIHQEGCHRVRDHDYFELEGGTSQLGCVFFFKYQWCRMTYPIRSRLGRTPTSIGVRPRGRWGGRSRSQRYWLCPAVARVEIARWISESDRWRWRSNTFRVAGTFAVGAGRTDSLVVGCGTPGKAVSDPSPLRHPSRTSR